MTFLCTQELQRAYRFITSLETLVCKESAHDQIISRQNNMTMEVSQHLFSLHGIFTELLHETLCMLGPWDLGSIIRNLRVRYTIQFSAFPGFEK